MLFQYSVFSWTIYHMTWIAKYVFILVITMTCEDTCNYSTILILGDIRQDENILNGKNRIRKELRHIPVLTWNNCTNFGGIFAQHVVIINSNHKNFFHFVNIFFCGTSKYNTTSTEMKRRNKISKAFSWNCSILRTKKSSSKIVFTI